MKVERYIQPKSSFLSIEKDMNIITNRVLSNERLKKLLYYTTPDALSRPLLTEEQSVELFKKHIRMIPKLYVDDKVLNYIIISFDHFIENKNNPEFRDNLIEFDIICHYDQWNLGDFQLRPYKIAAELDSMLVNTKLTGIGELKFIGATQMILTDEFGGLCLQYIAIHGGEDTHPMPSPEQEEEFLADFEIMKETQKQSNA